MLRMAAAGALLSLAACGARAPAPPPDLAGAGVGIALRSKEVPSGATQTIEIFEALNPDCSLEGYPSVHILRPPANGRMTIEVGAVHTDFPAGDVRAKCNPLSTPAILLGYASKPGYAGTDTAMVEVLFPMGAVRTLEYRILVR